MGKIRYHLKPHEDGWALEREGADRATKVFDTKAEGLDYAKDFVPTQGDSQLFVHKEDGTIQEERTYGHDPSSTPG